MTEAEVLTGGGIVLVAMTLIQISPIKLDPWSAIARAVGRAINKDVIDKLDETREILDAHIKMDGARTADTHRGGSCYSTLSCCGTFRTNKRNLWRSWRKSTSTKNTAKQTRITRTTGPPMRWRISAGYMMTD